MEEYLEKAKKVKSNAYAPYSNFEVGAVLKVKSGKIYTGCNIENNGIQSICAERVAFAKALSEGEREFESILVVGGEKGKEIKDECLPCGYCRQFMSEFTNEKFQVNTFDGKNIETYTMIDLLPHSFKLEEE